MKTAIHSFKYFLACLLGAGVLSLAVSSPTYACTGSFLGFPAWYNGIATEGSCDIKSPTEVGGIGPFIWIIVLNIVEIILRLAGWAAVAFIIYGGFKYMTSTGSPDSMVSARKTIMNAVIGLVISVMAIAIIRLFTGELGVD